MTFKLLRIKFLPGQKRSSAEKHLLHCFDFLSAGSYIKICSQPADKSSAISCSRPSSHPVIHSSTRLDNTPPHTPATVHEPCTRWAWPPGTATVTKEEISSWCGLDSLGAIYFAPSARRCLL